MGRPRTHALSLMSRQAIIEHVRELYLNKGPSVLTFARLKAEGVYFHLYQKGIKQKEVVGLVGASEEYARYKAVNFTVETKTRVKRRWTWGRVIMEATELKEKFGHLPPAQWFQQNNAGALVSAVYKFGRTWEQLREEIGCLSSGDYVQSRNGLRWKSHPEASLSNFLHARAIQHKVGEKYPEGIAAMSDITYAYYDLHFVAKNGEWIDVEIWGDRPNGHDEKGYARKRAIKEKFNQRNSRFLGIGYRDCFEEDRLTAILDPHIGRIDAFRFDKPTDSLLYSTHWSNADELIEFCRRLAEQQEDRIFPTESWLRKRGSKAGRDGVPYNTLSIYIKKWIGGVRKLRAILGQSAHSTIQWDEEKATERYLAFFNEHGITPGQAKTKKRQAKLSAAERLYANNICHAVETYAGGVKHLNAKLGISYDKNWKWSDAAILRGFRRLHDRYGLTPSQIAGASQENRMLFKITEEDRLYAKNLNSMVPEYFSRVSEVYRKLGIVTRDIRRLATKVQQ